MKEQTYTSKCALDSKHLGNTIPLLNKKGDLDQHDCKWGIIWPSWFSFVNKTWLPGIHHFCQNCWANRMHSMAFALNCTSHHLQSCLPFYALPALFTPISQLALHAFCHGLPSAWTSFPFVWQVAPLKPLKATALPSHNICPQTSLPPQFYMLNMVHWNFPDA